jgi:hypothetical protein
MIIDANFPGVLYSTQTLITDQCAGWPLVSECFRYAIWGYGIGLFILLGICIPVTYYMKHRRSKIFDWDAAPRPLVWLLTLAILDFGLLFFMPTFGLALPPELARVEHTVTACIESVAVAPFDTTLCLVNLTWDEDGNRQESHGYYDRAFMTKWIGVKQIRTDSSVTFQFRTGDSVKFQFRRTTETEITHGTETIFF